MRRASFVTAWVIAASVPLAGQEAVLRVTLEEAAARALANSHRLAEMEARTEAADAAGDARHAAHMPAVAAAAGYTQTNHVEEFTIVQPGQLQMVIYPDIPENYRMRVDFQWPIYTGGRSGALERAARAEHGATVADLEAARADLRLEVARAFWALVTARATEDVVERSLSSIDAHVRDLRSRLDQGLIPPNDLLSAQAQQSRERVQAIEARNVKSVAEADLQRLLGIDGGTRLDPVAVLDAPAPGVTAADPLVARALKQRPEREALGRRIEAASERVKAADASRLPQISVDGGYDYANPNPRIFPRTGEWHTSWDVSANLRWSLWDGGRRGADRREAAAGVRAAESRAAEFDRQVTFEVRQRWFEAESSRAAITAAEEGVRSATEAHRVVLERFAAGVATSTDVLDAEVALLQAALDRTRALASARLADARLQRAIGR